MIETGFAYIASLMAIGGLIRLTETTTRHRLFDYLPGVVMLYFIVMVLASLGLWSWTDDVSAVNSTLKSDLLPAMIFLLLAKADLRRIVKLGPRMLLAFAAATISIMIGFVVAFAIFQNWLEPHAWKAFAALSGSWMGGTGNMLAVQAALEVPDSSIGYTLLMDSVDYALWVVILLALVPFANRFNRWSGADSGVIDKVSASLAAAETGKPIDLTSILFLLGAALTVSAVSQALAAYAPTSAFFSTGTWVIFIATLIGVLAAMTPLGRMPGAIELGNVLLYAMIGLIASQADFAGLTKAPLYIAAGLVVLAVHGLCLAAAAKVFRLDLFSCGVASLANIGGVASAPILAAAYSEALVPIGVLMALLGYIVGTGGGLFVGKLLSLMI
ncbi:DUF819 domain-containing protein [Gimibacter soli]|uniref:DUF819 family protein n=1 Tax=Gimibacter soli TaxID=3024400 RepID=A0AAE9XRW4_9PROT|nr:DUF819 family protein [Gimibacter soli]WCL55241.1 DUF819 family protein [Gimibacter soli]